MRYSTAREARKRSLKESGPYTGDGFSMNWIEEGSGFKYTLRNHSGGRITQGRAKTEKMAVAQMIADIEYVMDM